MTVLCHAWQRPFRRLASRALTPLRRAQQAPGGVPAEPRRRRRGRRSRDFTRHPRPSRRARSKYPVAFLQNPAAVQNPFDPVVIPPVAADECDYEVRWPRFILYMYI